MTVTNTLIPTSGVHIIETYSPVGFNVARYDTEGFTSDGRWFPTLTKAEEYARQLKNMAWRCNACGEMSAEPYCPQCGAPPEILSE